MEDAMNKLIKKLQEVQRICEYRKRGIRDGYQLTDRIIRGCIAEVFEEPEVALVFEMLYELQALEDLKC